MRLVSVSVPVCTHMRTPAVLLGHPCQAPAPGSQARLARAVQQLPGLSNLGARGPRGWEGRAHGAALGAIIWGAKRTGFFLAFLLSHSGW